MNSLDTNILLYASNADCDEHGAARAVVEDALAHPRSWIVADQVYFELYRLLRNPVVLERPLTAADAWDRLDFYRHRSGWLHCAYETPFMDEVSGHLRRHDFAARRTFDLILAVTLKRHSVAALYTWNTDDFRDLGWFQVINPLVSSGQG